MSMMVAVGPAFLTDIKNRTLAEIQSNAKRVLTHKHLIHRVWGLTAAAPFVPCAPP